MSVTQLRLPSAMDTINKQAVNEDRLPVPAAVNTVNKEPVNEDLPLRGGHSVPAAGGRRTQRHAAPFGSDGPVLAAADQRFSHRSRPSDTLYQRV